VSAEIVPLRSRATELREAFDASFAEAPTGVREPTAGLLAVRLLAVRIGATPAAIRLRDIAGLHADKVVTAFPGSPPELLGLAGFRGAVVPVYDLGVLLGAPGTGQPRWCVVAAGRPPVAFAFHHFDGWRQVPATALAPGAGPSPHGSATGTGAAAVRRDVVTVDGQPRSIVEIGALVAAIAARTR
jgi:purine-binding chemotaxis protein CheW